MSYMRKIKMTDTSKSLTGSFFPALALLLAVFGNCFGQTQTAAPKGITPTVEQDFYQSEFAVTSGEVDSSFVSNLTNETESSANISRVVRQPDGKIIVAGQFNNVGGFTRNGIARLNADGSLDFSFDAGSAASGSSISTIALQADGKILVSGSFNIFNGVARNGIVRLNPNGSVDASFEALFSSFFGNNVQAIVPLADGRILVGGGQWSFGDFTLSGIIRLKPDGSLDETFNPGLITTSGSPPTVNVVQVQPDGKIIIAGQFNNIGGFPRSRIARLEANGSLDVSFDPGIGASGQINAVVTAPDGKIYIGGDFSSVNGVVRYRIARLNADGSLDVSYNSAAPTEIVVRAMVLQPDGKLLVMANSSFGGSSSFRPIFRLNPNGSNDAAFNPPTGTGNNGINGAINSFALEPDGKILIAGTFSLISSVGRRGVARLNADGSLDTSFVFIAGGNGTVNLIALQPDGKILITGGFSYVNGLYALRLARLNPDGSIDPTFVAVVSDSNFGSQNLINAMIVQPDGKIIIGGGFNRVNDMSFNGLARLNPNGSVDTSFLPTISGGFPPVQTLALQPNGQILVGGNFSQVGGVNRQYLARLNANGSHDTGFMFGTAVNGSVLRLALQSDGKVIITGSFDLVGGVQRRGIARLNADGNLDTSFVAEINGGGSQVNAVGVQSDGKIVLGGNFSQINTVSRSRLARLNADGSLDTTFAAQGGADSTVLALVVQPDDKIIVGGNFSFVLGAQRRRIARVNADGTIDPIFNPGAGPNSDVRTIVRQTDGKILIGGIFTTINGIRRTGVARLRINPCVVSPLFDFDGDGKTDVGVFQPASGEWSRLSTTNGALQRQLFGLPTDRIVPADYDGDGKTDIAVFRPSEGVWYLLRSRSGFQVVRFGASGDIPLAVDFDGDERDDIAVFRPSNGTWYMLRSSLGFTAVSFGAASDVPVIADMDGDCKADVTVYRPSNGTWYWLQSSNGEFRAAQFGAAGDVPTAGDYDGDGKTDLAVFRPSDGTWYLNQSQTGFRAVQFGAIGDRPVPADYDGDGKTDIAVFRPTGGHWYILRSIDGKMNDLQFGANGDIPVPAAYLPQ
jgi:uncharacterized delta-60 repeat protein